MRLRIVTLVLFLCSLQAQAQNMQTAWASGIGGLKAEMLDAVTVDHLGNVYTTGYFTDSATAYLGADSSMFISGPGTADAYIAKQNSSGAFEWVKVISSVPAYDQGKALITDKAGNLYVAGVFSGRADFNPGTGAADTFFLESEGKAEAFVLKLDAAGNFVWALSYGSTENDYAGGLALDQQENLYVAGSFFGRVDFNPGTGAADTAFIQSVGTGNAAYMLKLTPEGKFVWVRHLGSTGSPGMTAFVNAAADTFGNIYAVGNYRGDVYYQPGASITTPPLATAYGFYEDILVCKLDTAGNLGWVAGMGGPDEEEGRDIAVDPYGYVYVTGYFAWEADFDPGAGNYTVYGNADYEAYIVKLDSAGKLVWAKGLPGDDISYGYGVTSDHMGDVYITGTFRGENAMDPNGLSSAVHNSRGVDAAYLSKLDSSGALKWAYAFDGNSGESGHRIATDRSGHVYLAGTYASNDFDAGIGQPGFLLGTKGVSDMFTVKLVCMDTTVGVASFTECDSFTYYGVTYKTTGTYVQRIPNTVGCDSVVTLHLTIPVLTPEIDPDEHILRVADSFSSYQWYLNDAVIDGATGRSLEIDTNGVYHAVVIDSNGCTHTSKKYAVTNVSVQKTGSVADHIHIYPNPAGGIVYVNSPVAVDLRLTGLDGRTVKVAEQASSLSVSGLAPGVYLLHVTDGDGLLLKVEKLVKK